MSLVLETVVDSLQDLLGQLVKAMPALMSAVMVLLLTRYTVEVVIKIADEAGKKTLRSTSLQLLRAVRSNERTSTRN